MHGVQRIITSETIHLTQMKSQRFSSLAFNLLMHNPFAFRFLVLILIITVFVLAGVAMKWILMLALMSSKILFGPANTDLT